MGKLYTYKVRTANGKILSGTLIKDNASDVASYLRSNGYTILAIRESSRRSLHGNGLLSIRKNKISIKDLITFTDQLGTMLNAGVDMTRSLAILAKQTENAKMKEIISSLLADTNGGQSLSVAMSKYPNVFSNLYVSIVKAGESSGQLGDGLLDVSKSLERDHEIRKKIKGAFTYPIAVLSLSILIVIILFIFVIPKFKGFLTQLGMPLPTPTKITFALADFLIHWGWLVFAILISIIITFIKYIKTSNGKKRFDTIMLKLPVVGSLVKKTALARFANTFATLFNAGVSMIDALDVVSSVVDNYIISVSINDIKENVKQGKSLGESMATSGIFPPMVTEMTLIGEESGQLDQMLKKVSSFYQSEVNASVETITALINPIMMIFVGGIVGGVIISLYLPIFQMAGYVH